MHNTEEQEKIRNHIERLEVLSDIYHDFSEKRYPSKSEKDIAKLKMELVKKEMSVTYLLIWILTRYKGNAGEE
jgi:hypothetical protein